MDIDIDKIREDLVQISLPEIVIYGSHVTGHANASSDIDIAVIDYDVDGCPVPLSFRNPKASLGERAAVSQIENAYKVLGVSPSASDEELKRVRKRVRAKKKLEAKLQAANPKPVVYKKFSISVDSIRI